MSLVYVGVIQWIVVVRVVRIKFVGAFFLRLIAQIYSFFSLAVNGVRVQLCDVTKYGL